MTRKPPTTALPPGNGRRRRSGRAPSTGAAAPSPPWLAAMGLAWYLLATTLAGLVARVAGSARWSAAVDACSPGVVRRLVHGAAGLSVAATITGTPAAAWAAVGGEPAPASPVPIMRQL